MDERLRLDILQEECAELIHVCSKIKRFGIDNIHPKTDILNKEALMGEMTDVFAHIYSVIELYDLDDDKIIDGMGAKIEKVMKRHANF